MLRFAQITACLVLLCTANVHAAADQQQNITSHAVLDLYFVRHAETEANATGHYTSKTIDKFSQLGERMVQELTKKLSSNRFETICVSPMPRAEMTILPYLQATGTSAEIWPELAECCSQKQRDVRSSPVLRRGSLITIPSEYQQWLLLLPNRDRWLEPANYADGIAQVQLLVARIRENFGNSGKRVLLVGHSLAGSRMIELLLGKPPQGHINILNAEITRLQQFSDGTFHLLELNGKAIPVPRKPHRVTFEIQ